jgi:hypothetical protein
VAVPDGQQALILPIRTLLPQARQL